MEFFQDYSSNKKHKGIKKDSQGMEFDNCPNRIKSLVNFDTFEKLPTEYKEVPRFTVKQGEMVKTTVTKTKFSQLNDKRFYFPDPTLSLPDSHQCLGEIDKFKKQNGKKKGKYFWQENETLSNGKEKALKETHRLYPFHQILTQHPKVVNTKRKNDFEPLNQPVIKKTKYIILSGIWMK